MTSWRYIAALYARFFGIPLLSLGIVGDILNIYIFSTVSMYRQTASTFYLLCAVIANFIHLTCAMSTRILIVGFDSDLTRSSLLWCKIRQFIVATYAPLGLTFGSLATFDQFLVTSRNARFRQFSNIKNAHRITIVIIIIWHAHSIPFLIYNQIRNMRRLAKSGQLAGADRQLIKMVCLQLILVVLAAIPYGIYNTYILSTSNKSKNAEQTDRDLLFLTTTSLLGLFNFGGSFYVFLAASSRFRQIVREQLFRCCKVRNEINPNTMSSVRQP
ncbi:unnamed protein product [Rotaria sp. Silwood2]|nr:unnamed protein product [Rotaria sp. Silwood2]CAF2520663.1 unnamed protein product [Rotaria sp. Silwood2]CAF2777323.1 unnamed protein product [Rotaria sp. Silwood2]CAF2952222.1 unnamed protein product [Rotaria sp. Silwood2]CAF4242815.1 unnamed protein product [Rotaria sp. Silwood2]